MSHIKRSVLLVLACIFCVGMLCVACGNSSNKSGTTYTKDQLKKMEADELYEFFLEKGLKVDIHLTEALTENQLAEYIKGDFDLLIQGSTSRSDLSYQKLADDIKGIYDKVIEK